MTDMDGNQRLLLYQTFIELQHHVGGFELANNLGISQKDDRHFQIQEFQHILPQTKFTLLPYLTTSLEWSHIIKKDLNSKKRQLLIMRVISS